METLRLLHEGKA